MRIDQVVDLAKARLGITSDVRDTYIRAIAEGIVAELKNTHGIEMSELSADHLMFVVDYVTYRYSNRDEPSLPRHLQWRLHNMVVNNVQR